MAAPSQALHSAFAGVARLAFALAMFACAGDSSAQTAGEVTDWRPLWLISTRGAPYCGDRGGPPAELMYWQYQSGLGWTPSSREAFLTGGDAELPTSFFIHGNRYTHAEAIEYGRLAWRQLTNNACAPGPLRFVIWSWPSERSCDGNMDDVRIKAVRGEAQGVYLARLIDEMPPHTPVSIVGYSYGARLGTAALHMLGGGSLVGNRLAERVHPERMPLSAVLLAPGLDNDWLLPGRRHGLALDQVDRMLILYNSRDIVLKRYRFIDDSRPEALGYTGMMCTAATAGRVTQVDVAGWLGRSHWAEGYLNTPALVHRMLPYVFPRDWQVSSGPVLSLPSAVEVP